MGSRGRPDATALQDLTPMREGAYLESSYIPPSSSDLVTEQLLAMHQRMFEMDRRHREEVAALNAKHEEALRHILQMKALESQSLNAPLSALPSHAADASAAPAVPPVAIAQQEMMALPREEAALMAQLANGLAAVAAAEAADAEAIKSEAADAEAVKAEAAEAEAVKAEAAKAEAIKPEAAAEAEMAAWDTVAVEKAAAQKAAAQKAASEAAEEEATSPAPGSEPAVALASDALRWSPEIEMASGKELASSWTPQQVASAQRTSVLADRLVAAFNDAEDDDRRILALNSLYEAAQDAYGADAAATAAAVRKGGAIDGLTKCIESNSAELQQFSLALLGNLLTDAFDASARLSLALFVESGGLIVLLRMLHAEHPLVVFTLAALQNVTSLGSRQICLKVRELGFDKELIVLKKALKDEDETVSDYITAVLSNLRLLAPDTLTVDCDPALEEAIRMRRIKSVAQTIKSLNAATTMQRLGRRWIWRHRAKHEANKAKAAEAVAADGNVAAGAEAVVAAEAIAEQDADQLSNGEEAFAEATSDAPAMSEALAAIAAAFGLPALLAVLRKKSSSDEDQGDALRQLAQVVNDSYDSEAVALCEYLRAAGGVKLIVRLLSSPIPTVHQMAIMLVGNLASLAVDPHATKSKDVLKAEGAFSLLLPYMFSEDDMTLAYTLGALQNLCTEIEYVEQLEKAGGLERLQALIERKDPQLESFVRGCLSNVRTTKVRTTAATLSAPSKCPILVLSEYRMCPSESPYDCPSECRWWRPSSGASRSVNTSQPLPCRRMPADGWRVTARGSSARNWMRH